MNLLEEISEATRTVTAAAGASVVVIGRNGRGAGIVVGEGRVVTSAHNLRDRTTQVTFADGRSAQGTVAGVDADGDLAVLDVDTSGTSPVEWGETTAVRPGSPVFALANPGARGLRATFGTVSAVDQTFRGPRGRRVTGAFEHTAPAARGSSGGPVVDPHGRLLGINTHRLGDGFYLALPADAGLRSQVEALARGESPIRPRLGVGLAPSAVANRLRRSVGLPERDGLLVQAVEDGAPADRAGIRPGDLLVEVAGAPLARADDLLDAVEASERGATLALTVVRGVEERAVSVRFDDDGGGTEGSV